MREEFLNGRVTLHGGDSREVLKTLADHSIDSIVCDPPYALDFMAKKWDTGETAFAVEFWAECLRVLKPGGHVVAFSGTRTYHRMACAIEDAGFEIRDQLQWIYGSGFPKSHDVSKGIDRAAGAERKIVGRRHDADKLKFGGKHEGWDRPWMHDPEAVERCQSVTAPATDSAVQWQGWGTALKPACEPICFARKPLIGTVAANVLAHGTGAINIDGCRVEGEKPDTTRGAGGQNGRYGPIGAQGRILDDGRGRWPANILLQDDENEYELKPFTSTEQKRELYRWLSENA